jgi:subtilisin family serine protease
MAKRFKTKVIEHEVFVSLFPYEREDVLSIQEVIQQSGWHISVFNLPKLWEFSQGEGVVIGVIDTGCDTDHPDLVGNLLPGWNFVKNNDDPVDDNGHGTHVTGIMVAKNNEIGVVGVCPAAKVRPYKALDDKGNGNLKNVAAAVRKAADDGCDFIQMSLGAPVPVQQVRDAIIYAASKGCIAFVAAGNAGNTKEVFYPAAYPECISIGAIDESMRRAKFSNTGNRLDFMCPGVDILSTVPDDWYAKLSGTSMAGPFACGVAALIKSYNNNQGKKLKLETTEDYRKLFIQYTLAAEGNYQDPKFYYGYGIIDPRKFILF